MPDGFFQDGVCGDVWREDEARVMPEGVVGSQWFRGENIQHGKTQVPLVEMVEQGGFAGTFKVYGPLPLPQCAPGADTVAQPTSPR